MTRLLLALILFYRRFLSGRGPLRRVRCTFHHSESCSAFALRTARTSPFLLAISRIRRRLRRCRTSSIWAISPTHLAWGTDHDRPLPDLLSELTADDELPTSLATVLATRLVVSRYRHDLPDLLATLPIRTSLPHAHIVLRRGQVHRLKRGVTTSLLGPTASQ